MIHYPPVCGDVEDGGGDEAGDLPLGGVISAHLHRVARQQRPATLPHPRLAPGDTLVVIPVDTLVDMYPHLVPGSVLLPWLLVRKVRRVASTVSSRVRMVTRAGTH